MTETNSQIFLRAIGCNWLVCLAVWLGLQSGLTYEGPGKPVGRRAKPVPPSRPTS